MIWTMDSAGGIAACSEYTLLRDDGYSVLVGWIRGHTKIGPVREVRVTYHLEQYGIEIFEDDGFHRTEYV